MADLTFADKHNMCILLETTTKKSEEFKEIVHFLRTSELETAMLTSTTIYENHIRDFWGSAETVMVGKVKGIEASVAGQQVVITVETIRGVLNLDDVGHTTYTEDELRQVFIRMGCEGNVSNLRLLKRNVSYQWRFMWHAVLHSMAGRKAGWDNLNVILAAGIAALAEGKPFDWAQMVMDNLIKNVSAIQRNKFLMYPRFLQLMIDEQAPTIPHTGNILRLHAMDTQVWAYLRHDNVKSQFSRRITPLFPTMIDESEEEEDRPATESEHEAHEDQPVMTPPRELKSKRQLSPEPSPVESEPKRRKSEKRTKLKHDTAAPSTFEPTKKDKKKKSQKKDDKKLKKTLKVLKEVMIRMTDEMSLIRERQDSLEEKVSDILDIVRSLKDDVDRIDAESKKKESDRHDDESSDDDNDGDDDDGGEAEHAEIEMVDLTEHQSHKQDGDDDDDKRDEGDEVEIEDVNEDEEKDEAGETSGDVTEVKEVVKEEQKKPEEIPEDKLRKLGFIRQKTNTYINHLIAMPEGKGKDVMPAERAYWMDKVRKPALIKLVDRADKAEMIGSSNTVYVDDLMLTEDDQETINRVRSCLDDQILFEGICRELWNSHKAQQALEEDRAYKEAFNRILATGEFTEEMLKSWDSNQLMIFAADIEAQYAELGIAPPSVKVKKPSKPKKKPAAELVDAPVISDELIFDAQSDIGTLSSVELRSFLKRHGFKAARVAKMKIETLRAAAESVQENIIKNLPPESAELVNLTRKVPRDLDTRKRFYPRKLPQPTRFRIVHWKYDAARGCFLVKRINGSTQVFYNKHHLVRLTEEDLSELADLKLQNDANNKEAAEFEAFLKRQKKQSFDAVSKQRPSLKPRTASFLRAQGVKSKDLIRSQYLALKPEHVPSPASQSKLSKFKRWFLNESTHEMVIEREDEESIRIYHAAELNQFNTSDLKVLHDNPPVEKKEWSSALIDFMWSIVEKLLIEKEVSDHKKRKDVVD